MSSRYRVSGEVLPEDEIDRPSVDAVLEHIATLDGRELDQVYVELDGGGSIAVEGGEDELVAVCIEDKRTFHYMNTVASDASVVRISSGGQRVDRASQRMVPLAEVLEAIDRYLRTGQLSEDALWETVAKEPGRTIRGHLKLPPG